MISDADAVRLETVYLLFVLHSIAIIVVLAAVNFNQSGGLQSHYHRRKNTSADKLGSIVHHLMLGSDFRVAFRCRLIVIIVTGKLNRTGNGSVIINHARKVYRCPHVGQKNRTETELFPSVQHPRDFLNRIRHVVIILKGTLQRFDLCKFLHELCRRIHAVQLHLRFQRVVAVAFLEGTVTKLEQKSHHISGFVFHTAKTGIIGKMTAFR